MTKRDLVWDIAMKLALRDLDPDDRFPDRNWDIDGAFCHWHIRQKSDELTRQNKRTINRVLNEMVDRGWLNKRTDHRHWDEDDYRVESTPILYEPSQKLCQMVRENANYSSEAKNEEKPHHKVDWGKYHRLTSFK